MKNDSIFLMLAAFSHSCRFRIYEYVEKNETMQLQLQLDYFSETKWSVEGIYNKTCYRGLQLSIFFPPGIKPIDNEKFIFSPQETTIKEPFSIESFDLIELWEKNKIWTRSPLELPINFEGWIRSVWIVQLWISEKWRIKVIRRNYVAIYLQFLMDTFLQWKYSLYKTLNSSHCFNLRF